MAEFAVYRLYDAAGALLYVGMSESVFYRLEQHVKKRPWWSEVDHAEIEWFATREQIVDAELCAIRTESPRYNIQATGGPKRRRPTPVMPIPIRGRETFHRQVS